MKKGALKKFIITLSVLLILIYGAGALVFTVYSYPFTSFEGRDYGFLTKDKMKEEMDKTIVRNLEITEGTKTYEINGKDIGYKPSVRKETIEADKNPWMWVTEIFKNHEIKDVDVNFTVNSNLIEKALSESEILSENVREKPQNAMIVPGDGEYIIEPEKQGNIIDKMLLLPEIRKNLEVNNLEVNITGKDVYKKPSVKSDDPVLLKDFDFKNRWKNTDISLNIEGTVIPVLSFDNPNGFKTGDEEGFEENNTENIEKLVSILQERYDTVDKVRKFKNSYGDIIDIKPGNLGYEIDGEGLKQTLEEEIKRGNRVEIEVPFLNRGNKLGEADDIGNSYIEIDLAGQRMWVYENGEKVIESLIVTGTEGSEVTRTPSGAFHILYKQTDATLVGETPGDEYATFVNYWMPFTTRGHGLHDALWRGSFGGDTYLSGGSHGCVNLPFETAESVFNVIDEGIPVIIYGR